MKNKSIQIALLLALFAANAVSYAQKCKYDFSEHDSFTGEQKQGITAKVNNNFYFGFNKIGNNYNITIVVINQCNTPCYEGDSLMFKIVSEDNITEKILTLHSIAEIAPTMQSYLVGNKAFLMGVYRITYSITEEELNILSTGFVPEVRYNIGSAMFSQQIKKKLSKKIQQASICIIK